MVKAPPKVKLLPAPFRTMDPIGPPPGGPPRKEPPVKQLPGSVAAVLHASPPGGPPKKEPPMKQLPPGWLTPLVKAEPPTEPSPSLSMADIMNTAWAPPAVPSSSKDGIAAARVMGAMFGPKAQGEAAVPSSSPEPARPSCAAPRPSSAVAEFDIGTPRSQPEDAASSGDPSSGARTAQNIVPLLSPLALRSVQTFTQTSN